jgi:hypothetical protein
VILLEDQHDVLGLGGLGEAGEAAQIAEHGDDLAAVVLQHLLVAGRDDRLGELRREEAAQPADPRPTPFTTPSITFMFTQYDARAIGPLMSATMTPS